MSENDKPLHREALEQIFLDAHTHTAWLDKPVPEKLLHQVYEMARLGPTSANGSPARFVVVTSPAGKEKLISTLMPGNVDKTKAAPVTVIIAYDLEFYEKFPKLWTYSDMKSNFVGKPKAIEEYAFRNGTLQGAYFIIAARALGLDCGPMSGFDNEKVNAAFFPDGKWKSNFLVNLGYGDPTKVRPRSARLDFAEAAKIV